MWHVAVDVAAIGAAVTVAIVAGVFAGFAVAVMPGLRRVGDAAFVDTMRAIDKAIINPWFLGCFVGAIPLGALAIVGRWGGPSDALLWTIVGIVGHVAVVAITRVVHIPLNNGLHGATGDASKARAAFEDRWNRWHIVRTVVGVLATVALCVALLVTP